MNLQTFIGVVWLCSLIGANESASILTTFDKIVNLPCYGFLRGTTARTAWTNRSFYQFLGIKYAESPSGNRRFKAPVPVKPWLGIRDARNFGQKCPVLDDLLKMNENATKTVDLEDCLSLEIYTPNLYGSLPVMVYVHGGSFHVYSATEFPATYFLERDIVLVVVQYRLDALGFLSTDSADIPGNAGLKDVLLGLKFVKENIVRFGGDPNSVTLFGQSAGAAIVSALTISPSVQRSENLFHRVILQSGSVMSPWSYTTEPVNDARDIAQAAGLNRNQSIDSLNEAFMKMGVIDLLTAVDRYQKNPAGGPLKLGARSISIGGPTNLLPDVPQKILSSPRYKKTIPMIVGTTKDDGTYVATIAFDFLQAYMQAVGSTNGELSIVNVILDLLCTFLKAGDNCKSIQSVLASTFWTPEEIASGDTSKILPGLLDLFGTFFFKAPALELALSNAKSSNTFLYTFDYQGKYTRFGYGADTSHYPFKGGVTHSDDLIYLFPYPLDIADLNKADRQMAQKLLDLWTSFAANKSPHTCSDRMFKWTPIIPGKLGPYARIDTKLTIRSDYPEELLRNVSEGRKVDYSQLIGLLSKQF